MAKRKIAEMLPLKVYLFTLYRALDERGFEDNSKMIFPISLQNKRCDRVFIKRRQEAKMTASNHFMATSNAIFGI